MTTVTATEFKKHYGELVDGALTEPVVIKKHNRKSLVLISFKEFDLLEKTKAHYDELILKLRMDEAKKGEYVDKKNILEMLAELDK